MKSSFLHERNLVDVIGGGPAGLMAAEVLINAGVQVDLYDAMPSVGRKFLVAGKGGLNLTHSEPLDVFLTRYGKRRVQMEPLLKDFGPEELRAWAAELGNETFVGTSNRVFPVGMKTAPLLRAWITRLRAAGVIFHQRHKWLGWNADASLRFETPTGEVPAQAEALVLALGGGSWPQTGSTGAWVPLLAGRGVAVAPLKPCNCGFYASRHICTAGSFLTFHDSQISQSLSQILDVWASLRRKDWSQRRKLCRQLFRSSQFATHKNVQRDLRTFNSSRTSLSQWALSRLDSFFCEWKCSLAQK